MTDTSDSTLPKLTPKQRLFVDAYISNGCNATRAALAAGYSQATSYSQGPRLLKNVDIKAHIDRHFEESAMTREEVLFRLAQQARGDIGDIWDAKTGQVNWDTAKELGVTHLIKTIYHKTTRVSRGNDEDMEIFEDQITLHDPQKALQLIGKQLGLFVDKTETKLTGEVTVKGYETFDPDTWDASSQSED